MAKKNLLSLHEAVVIALVNLDRRDFTASFEDIAAYIEKRKLYPFRKGNVPLSTQVMLRTTKSQAAYGYLFEYVGDDSVRLQFGIMTNKTK
jgi:hypothetical protein